TGPPPPSARGPSQELAELLRKHGALADLPRLDSIQISRQPYQPPIKIFDRGTNDWNQFTLFEVLGVKLGLLAAVPSGETRSRERLDLLVMNGDFGRGRSLQNPDFAHVLLRRAASNGRTWKETTVDLSSALKSGDCSRDLALEWGDVVEILAEDRPQND